MAIERPDKHASQKAPDEAKLEIPENVPGADDKAERQPRKAGTEDRR